MIIAVLSAAFAPVRSGRRAAMRSRFVTSFPAGFAFAFKRAEKREQVDLAFVFE